jgi:choline kinase
MESELNRPSRRDKYTAIIPAAGMGRRMKTYGPKSLVKISTEDTILSRQIRILQNTFRYIDIIVVGGFEYDKLIKSSYPRIKYVYNKDYEDTNIAQSIYLGLQEAETTKIITIMGDLVFNQQCVNLPFNNESSVVLSPSMKEEEIGCVVYENKLQHLFYKLPTKWAQIAFFTNYELQLLFELSWRNPHWFQFELINEIIEYGGSFTVFQPSDAHSIDIDSSYDLKLMEQI